jgi:eukaryotic-like serine/threonine-protein kinase
VDDDSLIALAAAVADGASVDWASIESGARSPEEKAFINRLRLLADVAAVHRSALQTPPAEPSPTPDLPVGPASLKSGRYAIERSLGKGGYGVVYQAYDAERKTHVALKSLSRSDVGSIYDLKREFRTLADLSHPNLVSPYELFAEQDGWFIAMELVRGTDFLDYVRAGVARDAPSADAPAGLACDLSRLEGALAQLADAVGYLHAHSKLHRDIKPSNVLVTESGSLKLLDFGIAGDLAPEAAGDTMRVRGTPAYVSPEQANGEPATEASDWYSVGVILFESLTGQRPFNGTYLEVLAAKQHRDAPDPASLRPDAPAAMNALCRDLLARTPAERPSGAEVVARLRAMRSAAAPAAAPRRVDRRMRPPFVGRSAQLAILSRAYELSLLGRTQTVCVHGGSGIGKTALVRRFLRQLRDREPDVVVLQGRCYERESVPYKAVDHLVDDLSRYLRSLPRAEADALMPRDISALTRLFPILRRVDAIAEARYRAPQVANAQELRRRGFVAFRDLIARLSDRHPVVMVIDDLQWGDEDSAALLLDLLRTSDAPPVLFIACYRSEELFTSIGATSLFFTGDEEMHQVQLEELSEAEAHEFASALAGIYGGTMPVEAIVREGGGSPFLIDELVQYSAIGAPGDLPAPDAPATADARRELTLESVIRARIGLLSDRARRLLEVVAVFGGPLPVAVAIDAAQLTRGALEEITALRAANLTRMRLGSDEEIEIYHDRIREAIAAHIPPEERRQLHARIAQVLEQTGHADPETLLVQFTEAGSDEAVAHYAMIAADRARDALAFVRAARRYRLALAVGRFAPARRREIQIKLGDALAASGRGYEAAQAYLSAAEGALAAELLELKRRAADQLLRSGHIDEGLKAMRAVLGALGLKLAPTPARALLSLLLQRAWIRIRGLGFRERDRSQLSAEALVRVDACWSVATAVGVIDTMSGADFQAKHLLLALGTGDPHRIARALAVETTYVALSGARMLPRQEKLAAMAQRLAAQVGEPETLALVTLATGTAWFFQGRWRTAHEYLERAEPMLRECSTGNAWELDTTCLYHLLALFNLGEVKELSTRLPTFLKEARERDDLTAATNLRTRTTYLMYLAADAPEQAREEVRQGMAHCAQDVFHAQHSWELYARGEIALYEGRGDDAWQWVNQRWRPLQRSLLMRVQAVRVESLYLRARSALAAASARSVAPEERAALTRRAVRDGRRLGREDAAWARALSLLVRGGIATLRGNRDEALACLSDAEIECEALDMRLHAMVARRRRGELGGAAGAALVDEADRWMANQAIANPRRMADMLAPIAAPDTAA